MVPLMLRGALLVAATSLAMFGVGGPATADSDFGQHVRVCAQTMGFDGTHNPGMHRGHAGWTPEHSC